MSRQWSRSSDPKHRSAYVTGGGHVRANLLHSRKTHYAKKNRADDDGSDRLAKFVPMPNLFRLMGPPSA